MLLHIFVETVIFRKFKRTFIKIEIFCNIKIVFTATFDQINVNINLFLKKNHSDPELLNSRIYLLKTTSENPSS